MEPLSTVSPSRAFSSVICGSSLSTAITRLPQAMDLVSSIITIDTIISDMRISET